MRRSTNLATWFWRLYFVVCFAGFGVTLVGAIAFDNHPAAYGVGLLVVALGFLCLSVHGVMTSTVWLRRRGKHVPTARRIRTAGQLCFGLAWEAIPVLFGVLCAGVALWHSVRAFRQ